VTAEQVFAIVNPLAAVSWLLLIAVPRRRWVTATITGFVVPVLFAILYTALIGANFFRSPGGFGSLHDVARLFENQWLLLAGWIHYLAFDLLVGTWEARDAQARGVPHALLVPVLLLTFMFGPAGWLVYQALSARFTEGSSDWRRSFART
jgi:ABA4-like protein